MISAKPFRRALTSNSAATSFSAKIPTTTKPTVGSGIINLLDPVYGFGGSVPDWLELIPFGTDGENDTFNMRVLGWTPTLDTTPVWVPRLLALVAVVLGNIDGSALGTGVFMPDTLTLSKGPADNGPLSSSINSPANDMTASLLLHTRGCTLIEFEFDLAGGQEGVAMNCLWRPAELLSR